MTIKDTYKRFPSAVLLMLSVFMSGGVEAASVMSAEPRKVGLHGGESYADHISFVTDNDEVDMIVKLIFDEDANTLTVSALSYFTLMGFEQDVRYGSVIKWQKFYPEKMPYVMEGDPASKYSTTREFRSSMSPQRRKQIFRSWVRAKGANFDMGQYKVVNDYLERVYNVPEDGTKVEIQLGDMLVMHSPSDMSKKRAKYHLFAKRDLSRSYDVELMRDPCRGEDEALEITSTALNNIIASYLKLSGMAATDPNNGSRDSLDIFRSIKSVMLEQYKRSDIVSDCPDVERNILEYNKYIDSISRVEGYYVAEQLDPQIIYDAARQVDRYNTRWSLSKDEVERADIVTACKELIGVTATKIAAQDNPNGALRVAFDLFWSAESNFYFITGAK